MKVTRDDVIDIVRSANVVENAEGLRGDVALSDQGIDSLGVFNILLLMDEKYGIETPDEDIDNLVTIDTIVAYLNKRLA